MYLGPRHEAAHGKKLSSCSSQESGFKQMTRLPTGPWEVSTHCWPRHPVISGVITYIFYITPISRFFFASLPSNKAIYKGYKPTYN